MNGIIPGNLLLFGEYAVLEEKGLGLCAAVHPVVKWSAKEGSLLSGRQGNNVWEYDLLNSSEHSGDNKLLFCCWKHCLKLADTLGRTLRAKEVIIDSSSFVSEDRKLGFGSSAAAAAAAVKAILSMQEWSRDIKAEQIMHTAFLAHSSFQGKSGSGYDVYTSLSESVNLFTGGIRKKITRGSPAWLKHIGYFQGSKAVSTVKSVSAYSVWKKSCPEKAEEYLEKSNKIILKLIDADAWAEAGMLIKEIRDLSQQLGREIGVSAEFDLPAGLDTGGNIACKASGAGNELILVFSEEALDDIPGIKNIKLFGA